MKIFISHASANKEYGNSLVELFRGIGIDEDEIIFTSNVAYGIPIGQNIFNWLKSQISEKPFVIYLLSKEYYSSIACLNEMGAAWIIENEHAVIFTPNFDIRSKEFQNGALDPREIGFHINDEERLLSFIEQLGKHFNISKKSVIINQKLKKYLKEIDSFVSEKKLENQNIKTNIEEIIFETKPKEEIFEIIEVKNDVAITNPVLVKKTFIAENGIYSKFVNEIVAGKLKDDELILLNYILETSKIKLMTGWQEEGELRIIKEWEEINELNNTLSRNYSAAIRRFELRGYTEISAVTSSGNPKEVKLKAEIESNILDLSNEILDIINNAISKNKAIEIKNEDLPF
ncbi:toll/interleukin-1 receptor domain-containing protein [Flavobacterium sp. XS2P12]|uniref:toll/interleukin-1 receptor domain-containing protein n=1 Tax=Flavobacterium melibiosi TaxID=3398734 RepID=UPI003A868D11